MAVTHRTYDQDLARLDDMLRSLNRLVISALRQSLLTLRRMDAIGARALIREDQHINALQADIDTMVYRLVALRQPVARDLRLILGSASVASELERAGDYAKTVARAVLRIEEAPARMDVPAELAALGELAVGMLDGAVAAFLNQDAAAARALAHEDDQADLLARQLVRAVRDAAGVDVELAYTGLALLRVAAALERLADRATNIAERTVFFATGETELLNE
jgi:phosphate transport system protein